jgi:hypothetical protein
MKTSQKEILDEVADPHASGQYVIVTLRVPAEHLDTIRTISKETGLTQQHLMRASIKMFLQNPVLPARDLSKYTGGSHEGS